MTVRAVTARVAGAAEAREEAPGCGLGQGAELYRGAGLETLTGGEGAALGRHPFPLALKAPGVRSGFREFWWAGAPPRKPIWV